MSSEELSESEVSRFTLDGVVAEMVIEVDENNGAAVSPSKSLKLGKYLKKSTSLEDKSDEKLDTEDSSRSASDSQDSVGKDTNENLFTESEENLFEDIDQPSDKEMNMDDDQSKETSEKEEELVLEVDDESEKESEDNMSDFEDDKIPEEKFETESSASGSIPSVPLETNIEDQDQNASELSEEELFGLNASEEKYDSDSNASSENKEEENSFKINMETRQVHNQKVHLETEEKLSDLDESEEKLETDSNASMDNEEKETSKVTEESSKEKSDVDELDEKESLKGQESDSDTSLGYENRRKPVKSTITKKESHALEVSKGESEENVSDLEEKGSDSEKQLKTTEPNSEVKKRGRPFKAMKQKHYEEEDFDGVKSDSDGVKEFYKQETKTNTNSGMKKRGRPIKTTKQKNELKHGNDSDEKSDANEKDEEEFDDEHIKESNSSSNKKKVVRKVPVQVDVVSTSSTSKKGSLPGSTENNDSDPEQKQQKHDVNVSIKKRGRLIKTAKSETEAIKRKDEEERGPKKKRAALDKSSSKEPQENLENSFKKKRGRPINTTKQKLDIKRTALPVHKKSELLNSPRFRTRPSLQNEKSNISENSTPKGSMKRKATDSKGETEVSEKKLKSVSMDTPEAKRGRKPNTVADNKSGSNQSKKQSLKSSSMSRLDSLLNSRLKLYTLKYGDKPSLGSFPEIKENVSTAHMRSLRYMHRVLYDRWAPKVEEEVRTAVLGFNGFPFNRKADAFEIRQQLLAKMPDNFIDDICNILDLKEGKSKPAEIMKFLLKPSKSIMSPVDPSEKFMQPVLKLQKITFDNKYLKKVQEVSSKRKRFPPTKLEIYLDPSTVIRRPSISEKPQSSSTNVQRKKQPTEKSKTSEEAPPQQQKAGLSRSTDRKMSLVKKLKKKALQPKTPITDEKADLKAREKVVELAQKIKETEDTPDSSSDDDVYVPLKFHPETVIKQEPMVEEDLTDYMPSVDNSNENEDSSSEVTLSADETKDESKHDSTQKRRILYRRVGKPLTCFDKVKENVLTGGFSALQRLHILLFGSSDKAENLKSNILAFGGFPFLEGSDEWKQKEFLLSLVAQNTLREYLVLLDIKHTHNDDQRTLITKLMKFLAIPTDSADIEIVTKVISSEPTSVSQVPKITGSVYSLPKPKTEKKKDAPKKKGNKPEQRGLHKRARKVLMDENQVRRMEADLAREQRILERERRLNLEKSKKFMEKMGKVTAAAKVKQPTESSVNPLYHSSLNKRKLLMKSKFVTPLEKQSDVELLNALLETVRQRRALQHAGAIVSIPNRGQTRLGDLDNVKFLVVTANYNDLDVLHYLIYMSDASKHRVRKNILDFAGFNFTEESPAYKERINFMESLGYDITKRIGFLLGLCPFKAEIIAQDLNELIMYFLMSPCQTKQVPIKHLPQNFFNNDMPEELCNLLKKHAEEEVMPTESLMDDPFEYVAAMHAKAAIPETQSPSTSKAAAVDAPPRKKAKKSFKSCLPPNQIKGLSPSISTLPLKAPTTIRKLASTAQKTLAPMILPPSLSSILSPGGPIRLQQAPSLLQPNVLKKLPDSTSPQEFFIQQQTPDGKQKTFKLIKLPPNHPLNSVLKTTTTMPQPMTVQAPPVVTLQTPPTIVTQQPPPISVPLNQLPPGLIIFTGNNQTAPVLNPPVPGLVTGVVPVTRADAVKTSELVTPEDKDAPTPPVECDYGDDEIVELNPLEEGKEKHPPTDAELFTSIQEVIHTANFEDITLRNVIDRVAAEYSDFDLIHRHIFMKECVKKIIMGS